MLRLLSLCLVASSLFVMGCGANTASTPAAVDDSVVHTPEVMADMQKQNANDAAGSN